MSLVIDPALVTGSQNVQHTLLVEDGHARHVPQVYHVASQFLDEVMGEQFDQYDWRITVNVSVWKKEER